MGIRDLQTSWNRSTKHAEALVTAGKPDLAKNYSYVMGTLAGMKNFSNSAIQSVIQQSVPQNKRTETRIEVDKFLKAEEAFKPQKLES